MLGDREESVCMRARGLAELAIFTAATVVAAELGYFAVFGFLASDAQPNAGNGVSARLRYLFSAIRAMR